jgi:hypothetical protein
MQNWNSSRNWWLSCWFAVLSVNGAPFLLPLCSACKGLPPQVPVLGAGWDMVRVYTCIGSCTSWTQGFTPPVNMWKQNWLYPLFSALPRPAHPYPMVPSRAAHRGFLPTPSPLYWWPLSLLHPMAPALSPARQQPSDLLPQALVEFFHGALDASPFTRCPC